MHHAPLFAARRQTFMQALGNNHIAILFSADEQTRNGDATYPYRQDSNFYYLSGLEEAHSVLVFVPGRPEGEFVIFNRKINPEHLCWHGDMVGQEDACSVYGADQAFDIQSLSEQLPLLLSNCSEIHYAVGTPADDVVLTAVETLRAQNRKGQSVPDTFVDVRYQLSEMRLIKSDFEIERMRRAAEISANAHQKAMQHCQSGMMEYELEAELLHTFYKHGSRFPAYSSIVGGGANACVLHYVNNTAVLNDNELVLIDAGAEYDYYASDITRTFPINGRFSDAQRAVYQLVLDTQEAVIEAVKPGVHWQSLQDITVRSLTEGLVQLGLLQGEVDALIKSEAYKRFYMHRFGHWLGMDVHDVGAYKIDDQWRPLQAGMALTVEPGLYITAADDIPSEYHNIGVRIEDDVLVTTTGCEVLSHAAPKTIAEIEACMEKSMVQA